MFARALLVESYAISPGVVGVLLGAVALAALPGKMLARPWLAGHARELLVVLGIAAALLTALFGIVRPGAAASTAILAWMQSSALAPTTRPLRTTSGRASQDFCFTTKLSHKSMAAAGPRSPTRVRAF